MSIIYVNGVTFFNSGNTDAWILYDGYYHTSSVTEYPAGGTLSNSTFDEIFIYFEAYTNPVITNSVISSGDNSGTAFSID